MGTVRGARRRGAALAVALCLATVGVVVSCRAPIVPLAESRLARLQARAELARERRFRGGVDAWEVKPDAVEPLLAAQFERIASDAEFADDERLAHVLGWLPRELRLREELLRFQARSVAGFYAPLEGRLYVVVGHPAWEGALADSILVHELAHALQADRAPVFDALVGLSRDDDLIFALGALLEGDALFTEFRDEALQTGLPQRTALQHARQMEVERLAARDVPRILRDTFYLQYPLGYSLVEALVLRGGIDALDAALLDPPLGSEELLHPERYLEPSKRRPRPDFSGIGGRIAPPGCRVRNETTAGELGIGVFLEEAGRSRADAQRAADGWDGDRAWLFACGDVEAFAWLFQLDREADAAELVAALDAGAWPGDLTQVRAPLSIARSGKRVLVDAGLPAPAQRFLLDELVPPRHETLSDYLRDHPEVAARAARLRDEASR